MKNNISNKHKCINCSKLIDYRNKYCQKCWGKSIRKPLPKCVDCGKKLSKRNSLRCVKCKGINSRGKINLIGKNNPNFGKKHPGTNKGRKNGMFGKPTPHGKRIKYKNIWMRSSWEVAYAKYLDKQGIKWLYESKTFDLGNTTYTPDFYFPKTDIYIEIKGYWRDDAKKKFRLFKKRYKNIKIKILDYNKLKKLRILK